jgi:hypothetical protein
MQVVCSSCQLNFQAPDGATGLVCPICRSPLRAQTGGDGAANKNVLDWNGGTLDDLIAILSGPAHAVRVEVLPAQGDTPAGEVHLLAGGVSDALIGGKVTDDALDRLRAITPARFRVEPRLPNPADGDLTYPGPDSGTLDSRPLAHLMRYCEQYVITCAIDVWRGNENARVEYRKGEIGGVTVGGIDAPERLAEVMQWSSGNYRLVVPRLTLPDVAPARPAAATKPAVPAPTPSSPTPAARPAAAPAPAAPAMAASGVPAAAASTAESAPTAASPATRTIFGMPALDAAALRALDTGAAPSRPAAPAPAPAAAAPPAAAATQTSGPTNTSATKTIFGVPAASIPSVAEEAPKGAPARMTTVGQPPVEAVPAAAAPASAKSEAKAEAKTEGKTDKKTGARKTAVPKPEIIAVPPAAAAVAAAPPAATDVARSTREGYDKSGATEVVAQRQPPAEDRTQPVRTGKKPRAGASVWTYVGVGFLLGLALLGVYQLYGAFGH